MRRVATMTVVKGQGEVRELVDAVVQKEIERLQKIEKQRMEEERALVHAEVQYLRGESEALRRRRNRMLAEKAERLDEAVAEMRKPSYRIKFFLQYCIAVVYVCGLKLLGKSV